MATFEGAAHLDEQLASLARQDRVPAEVVVCDDGSTDGTLDILDRFRRVAPFPVTVVRNDRRLGYSDNFRKAMALCRSPVIALCDQDDVWDPAKIAVLAGAFDDPAILLVNHDYRVAFADGTPQIASYFDRLEQAGLPVAVNLKGCSLAFRRELAEKAPCPLPLVWTHDTWLCAVAQLAGRRSFVHRPLMTHRIHGGNAMGRIVGVPPRVARIVSTTPLPFVGRGTEDDVFLAHIAADGLEAVPPALDGIGVEPGRRDRILASLARRGRIRYLTRHPRYGEWRWRVPAVFEALARGDYRTGNGLRGVVADLRGRREGQP